MGYLAFFKMFFSRAVFADKTFLFFHPDLFVW